MFLPALGGPSPQKQKAKGYNRYKKAGAPQTSNFGGYLRQRTRGQFSVHEPILQYPSRTSANIRLLLNLGFSPLQVSVAHGAIEVDDGLFHAFVKLQIN